VTVLNHVLIFFMTSGSFGAVLMKTPSVVASCVEAMKKGVQIPVTVKHRIGVDELDSYEQLRSFVHTVSLAGCDRFIIHARCVHAIARPLAVC
jgi:tRNA-dihydrouridine synthase A